MPGTASVQVGLYQNYAEAWHFGNAIISLLASVSALGVIVAVTSFGDSSDRAGRRKVMLWAIGLGFASILSWLFATHYGILLGGRVLNGFAAAYTGAATAAMTELVPPSETRRAATHAATASMVGFAAGPLIGGFFVQYGPWPLRLVYVLDLVLFIPPLLAVLRMKETAHVTGPLRPRLQTLEVPHDNRRLFVLAVGFAFCTFALTSFFLSLAPTVVITLLGVSNRATAAAIVFGFLGTSVLSQTRLRALPIRVQGLAGLTLLPMAVGLLVSSLVEESLPLFIAAALLGGLAQGLSYLSAQSIVEYITPAHRRGAAFSTFMVIVYWSGALTATTLGQFAKHFGLHRAAIGYGLAVASLALVTVLVVARAAPRGPRRVRSTRPLRSSRSRFAGWNLTSITTSPSASPTWTLRSASTSRRSTRSSSPARQSAAARTSKRSSARVRSRRSATSAGNPARSSCGSFSRRSTPSRATRRLRSASCISPCGSTTSKRRSRGSWPPAGSSASRSSSTTSETWLRTMGRRNCPGAAPPSWLRWTTSLNNHGSSCTVGPKSATTSWGQRAGAARISSLISSPPPFPSSRVEPDDALHAVGEQSLHHLVDSGRVRVGGVVVADVDHDDRAELGPELLDHVEDARRSNAGGVRQPATTSSDRAEGISPNVESDGEVV